MGIFDWLSGKRKQNKKEKTSELTDYQKHWLGLVDEYVKQEDFDFIKTTYTIDSLGEEHFELLLSEDDEHGVTKDERKEGVQSRVDGLLSIRDYINTNGSEEQKFHYESSLKGAVLYASSLGINFDLPPLNLSSSESFKFSNSFSPASFDKIINKMRELLGNEVFDIIGENSGFMLDDDHNIDVNITPSKEQLLHNFYENYRESSGLCAFIANEEKISHSEVIDEMIPRRGDSEHRRRKTPNWIKNLSDSSKMAANHLFNTLSFGRNILAYEEGFELGAFDKGILASSESIFNRFLENEGLDEINDNFKDDVAAFLDTFGYGLYLKNEFESSIIIHDKSIELSPYHEGIAEHITNRGKSKLKLNDFEGAKLDFEKALEKDEDFEEAKSLLKSINK